MGTHRREFAAFNLQCALLALLLACHTDGDKPGPSVPSLEESLLAATRHPSPELRSDAVRILGQVGSAVHVNVLGELLADEQPAVRLSAVSALSMLARLDPEASGICRPYLLRALQDGVESCRVTALLALGSIGTLEDAEDIALQLSSASPRVRIIAAMALASMGATVADREIIDLLRTYAGGSMDRQLARALDLLRGPEASGVLQPLLESEIPMVAELAQQAAERLAARAAGHPLTWKPPARVRADAYAMENRAARIRIRTAEWREIDPAEFEQRISASRLVLFGEFHQTSGPLRDAQASLLEQWSQARQGPKALGFEPSVQEAQSQVLAVAARLGVRAIPTERRWQDLQPRGLHAERDDETAEVINEWMRADARNSMFVLRGQDHVLPGGYLVSKLDVAPVIVLCGWGDSSVPLPALGTSLELAGRVFQLGVDAGVYVLGSRSCIDGLPEPARFRRYLAGDQTAYVASGSDAK